MDSFSQCQAVSLANGEVCTPFQCDPVCLDTLECSSFFGDWEDCCASGRHCDRTYLDDKNPNKTVNLPLLVSAIIAIFCLCCIVLCLAVCFNTGERSMPSCGGERRPGSRWRQMIASPVTWLSEYAQSRYQSKSSQSTENGIGFDNDITKLTSAGQSVLSHEQVYENSV